ncbi:MAG: chemotaxis protein CheD [Planctomycetota bacterium]|nr:MAG: chemotaxis protein CheD [Planctomycetota bacterium]
MKKVIDVRIGQVKVQQGKVILESRAIGSCIAIVAYDVTKGIGALAHVMLPGRAPADKETSQKTRYAADAIDAIVSKMARLGSKNGDIEVALVGGANVLNKKDDTICKDNIESVLGLLEKKRLKVRAQSIGGTNRRNVFFDIGRGVVSYSEGNGDKVQLWRP